MEQDIAFLAFTKKVELILGIGGLVLGLFGMLLYGLWQWWRDRGTGI